MTEVVEGGQEPPESGAARRSRAVGFVMETAAIGGIAVLPVDSDHIKTEKKFIRRWTMGTVSF